MLHLDGGAKPGRVDRNHGEGDLDGYHPLERRAAGRGVPPGRTSSAARSSATSGPRTRSRTIRERGRTPLTIDEGIALVTQVPPMLEKNKCFMLAGSRSARPPGPGTVDQRAAPKLGWCWDGNPHTWLGTASAGSAPRVTSPTSRPD